MKRAAILLALASFVVRDASAQTCTAGPQSMAPTGTGAATVSGYGTTAIAAAGNRIYAFQQTPSGFTALWPQAYSTSNNVQGGAPLLVPLGTNRQALFTGDLAGFVYGIDFSTGQNLWAPVDLRRSTCTTGDQILALPAVQLRSYASPQFQAAMSDDLVMVGTRYGCGTSTANRVYALHAADGSIAWTFNAAGTYAVSYFSDGCSIDYGTDTAYCGADQPPGGTQSTLFALSTIDGSVRWRTNLGPIRTRVTVGAGGRLYVTSYDGVLHAVDPATGREVWRKAITASANITYNPWAEFRSPYAGWIFVTTTDGTVFAEYDDGTGAPPTEKWHMSIGATTLPAVQPSAGVLYVGTQGGAVQQLSIDTGVVQGSIAFANSAITDLFLDSATDLTVGVSGGIAHVCIPWPLGTGHT